MRRFAASVVAAAVATITSAILVPTGAPARAAGGSRDHPPVVLTGTDTVTVYGPVTFEHPGPDNGWAVFTDAFNVTDTRGRRYLVEADGSGPRRVSVGGQEYLGQNDAASLAIVDVTTGSNLIGVAFKGLTGTTMTVRVVHVSDPTYAIYPRTKFSHTSTTTTYSGTFAGDTANAAPVGMMHVINGAPGGTKRMTSGSIKLNGVTVASGAGDFGTGKASFVKNVTLLTADTLQVLNQSSDTTSCIHVSFRATDDTPPVVTINWPPSPFLTDSAAATLIGTVVDQTPCSLSVNDGPWSAVDGGFVTSFPLPADGPYTARITVRNSAGLSTTVNRSIVRDTQVPVLTVIRPLIADTTVTDSSMTLAGWWDDLTATTVTVDDDTVGADTSGTISLAYPLDMGPNRILIRGRDALGHVREITKHVFRRLASEPAAPDSNQAPPLDYSRFNSFFESVRFIFENSPKRQESADSDSNHSRTGGGDPGSGPGSGFWAAGQRPGISARPPWLRIRPDTSRWGV